MPSINPDHLTTAGFSAAVVNVLTETLHPLIVLAWSACPVRLVAFCVCGVAATTGRYPGGPLRALRTWLLATLCLYAAALGVNKGVSEVRQEIRGGGAQAQEQQPTPRRPGDPW